MKSESPVRSLCAACVRLAIACLGFCGILEVSEQVSHWNNRNLIDRQFEERLLPTAAWVRGFESREQRLPTDEEVKGFCIESFGGDEVGIYREAPRWEHTWGAQSLDFMLCSSISGWNLCYCSWNGKRSELWIRGLGHGFMKWWRLILFVLVLVPPAFFAADIENVGLWTWLRDGWKQPGLKWFGWYFPRGWKTIGPLLYLGLIVCCVVRILWL
jgi:hypothetical protein